MVRMVVVLVCCWCVDEEFEFGAVAEYGFVLVTGVDKLRCPCCCVDFFVEAHIFSVGWSRCGVVGVLV